MESPVRTPKKEPRWEVPVASYWRRTKASLSGVLGCSLGTQPGAFPACPTGAQGHPVLSTLSFSAASLHLTLPGPETEGDPLVGLGG